MASRGSAQCGLTRGQRQRQHSALRTKSWVDMRAVHAHMRHRRARAQRFSLESAPHHTAVPPLWRWIIGKSVQCRRCPRNGRRVRFDQQPLLSKQRDLPLIGVGRHRIRNVHTFPLASPETGPVCYPKRAAGGAVDVRGTPRVQPNPRARMGQCGGRRLGAAACFIPDLSICSLQSSSP